MTSLYPIFADLQGRAVLVVGGGRVAARKVAALMHAGAQVTVVAPQLCEEIVQAARRGDADAFERPFEPADLAGAWLVVASTDDPDVNARVYKLATDQRIFCNVVDQPDLCSFHVPAVVRRGLLQVAVSTGGAGPAFARRLKERLEGEFGPQYGPFVDALLRLRRHLKQKYADQPAIRRRLLESFLDEAGPVALAPDADPAALEEYVRLWESR